VKAVLARLIWVGQSCRFAPFKKPENAVMLATRQTKHCCARLVKVWAARQRRPAKSIKTKKAPILDAFESCSRTFYAALSPTWNRTKRRMVNVTPACFTICATGSSRKNFYGTKSLLISLILETTAARKNARATKG